MSPRRNFLLTLAYDGTDFHGWQRLPAGERSVQAELEAALAAVLGEPVEATGAGRTDRGVHAEGQAASFHSRTVLSPSAIREALNRVLPPDLVCRSCREVDPRFHARFRAQSKLYRYRLHLGPAPDPFLRRYSLHVPGPLDLGALERAARFLVGERDFGFLSNEKEKAETGGRLDAVRVEARPHGEGGIVDILFEGPGFLYHQVRVMAALLLEVGEGKRSPESIPALLERKDRGAIPGALGPFGLCLVEVRYALPAEDRPDAEPRDSGRGTPERSGQAPAGSRPAAPSPSRRKSFRPGTGAERRSPRPESSRRHPRNPK